MKLPNKYTVLILPKYERSLSKIAKKNRSLALKVKEVVRRIRLDPSRRDVGTHVVTISSFGKVNSSRVNGDTRILWVLEENRVIVLLCVGGHSGGSKVYR